MMRFINEDIVTGDISNSNSLNRYSYVEGNPVTMVDPFGLEAKDAQKMDIFDRISEGCVGLMNAVKGVCMGMEGGAAIGTGIILVLSGPAGWIMGGVMIVGGAYVATCGLADGIEGGHQIVEAVTGTPQDTSNFVRDNVFAWDPDVYYISEALATCGVSELIRSAQGFLPSSGGITTQINGEGSSNSGYYQDSNGRWHRPNGEFASNAEVGISSPTNTSIGSHGNSLSDPRTNYGYALVNKDTNEILKFGETLYPDTRYSQQFLEENNAVMKILISGSKEEVHYWQYDMNKYYYDKYNEWPSLLSPNTKGY